MLTLRHLRYFEALSRHRHFSRAADECMVTQPALSTRIQELEASLGVALVERRRGALGLTQAGEEVARRAAQILLSVQDLRDYAVSSSGPLTGSLALGIIPTVAPYILAPMLQSLRAAFPELNLAIFETQTDRLIEDVSAGRIDAALLSLPVVQAGLSEMPLFDDGFFLAVHADSPLSGLETVSQRDIAESGLLLLDEGHCLRDQVLSVCRIAPKQLRERYGATSLATIMQLIASGQGVTILPEIAVPVEMRGNTRIVLRRFGDAALRRTLGLVWRETSPRSADFQVLGQQIAVIGREAVAQGRDFLPGFTE